MNACERCGTVEREVNLLDALDAWLCESCAAPHLPRAPEPEKLPEERRPDPFARPLDRLLAGLRRHCGPDPYVTRGLGVWLARCPLHPDAGYTLLVTELPEVELYCSIGCPEWALRSVLLPDPEAEQLAWAYTAVLLWAQSYRKEGRRERTRSERRAA